jgi:DnaJ-class molecular chaperone
MEKEVPALKTDPCPECRGSGWQAVGCNLLPCPECLGKGIKKESTEVQKY